MGFLLCPWKVVACYTVLFHLSGASDIFRLEQLFTFLPTTISPNWRPTSANVVGLCKVWGVAPRISMKWRRSCVARTERDEKVTENCRGIPYLATTIQIHTRRVLKTGDRCDFPTKIQKGGQHGPTTQSGLKAIVIYLFFILCVFCLCFISVENHETSFQDGSFAFSRVLDPQIMNKPNKHMVRPFMRFP